MAEENEEKTEAPSQKRRDDAREEGQVAYSKEVSSALLLGGFLLLFWFSGSSMTQQWEEVFAYTFSNLHQWAELDISLVGRLTQIFMEATLALVVPFFGVALVVGVLASVAQVGFHVTGKPLMPNLGKLNPLKGIGRIFSKQSLSELVKSLFKMGVIVYLGYGVLADNWQEIQNLAAQDPRALLRETAHLTGIFAFRLFIALLAMAAFDYLFQRWDLEQKLKMSKQDIKEEMKQAEGDPHIKARIRQVQQEMSRARMMQEVPKADVVVTNPTHFAVALQYDREVMTAPRVLAKGADFLAFRIIEIARENDVIVYESPPVARGLYFQSEIGDEIPEEFYRAMAEILAFVYKVRKRK